MNRKWSFASFPTGCAYGSWKVSTIPESRIATMNWSAEFIPLRLATPQNGGINSALPRHVHGEQIMDGMDSSHCRINPHVGARMVIGAMWQRTARRTSSTRVRTKLARKEIL